MEILESLTDRIRGRNHTVVLPEGGDDRILSAARKLVDRDIAAPVVLGDTDDISGIAQEAEISLDGIAVRDPATDGSRETLAALYAAKRDKANEKTALRALNRPLYFGGMLVAANEAQAMIAGVGNPTKRVIEAGLLTVGMADGIETPSSFFLMVLPDFLGTGPKTLVYADCAVNVDPSAAELADIAVASAYSARPLLGEEPRLAMLSFSTQGSARHPNIDKVTEALSMVRDKAPGIAIDGEFQVDAALIPAVAEKKTSVESVVAGNANVLIFPDLDAGNIAYKLTQYVGNAQAIGPVLQGFARPVSDLSRGATVDDVIHATVLALSQLQN